MIDINDLLAVKEAAKAFADTIAQENCELRLAVPEPMQIPPEGWRFLYDCFVHNLRVRKARLTVFVDEEGAYAEWDDIKPYRDQITAWHNAPPPNIDFSESEQDKVKQAILQYSDKWANCEFLAIDCVWVPQADGAPTQLQPQWRVDVNLGIKHYVIMVALNHQVLGTQDKSVNVNDDWVLGRIIRTEDCLTVDLTNQPDLTIARWIAFSAIASAAEAFRRLGYYYYHKKLFELKVDYCSLLMGLLDDNGAGFYYSPERTVRFLEEGGWASEISIILHEVGHAVWYDHFPHHELDPDPAMLTLLKGIEEGFADFFAACLLAQGTEAISIGDGVTIQNQAVAGLPRVLTGKPLQTSPASDVHSIGHQWANLLWGFRNQVLSIQQPAGLARLGRGQLPEVDRVILRAHLSNRVPRSGIVATLPTNPKLFYIEMLKQHATAANLTTPELGEADVLKILDKLIKAHKYISANP